MEISKFETTDVPRVARLLKEPAHTDTERSVLTFERKPTHIAISGNTVVVAAEDGSLWTYNLGATVNRWHELPALPRQVSR